MNAGVFCLWTERNDKKMKNTKSEANRNNKNGISSSSKDKKVAVFACHSLLFLCSNSLCRRQYMLFCTFHLYVHTFIYKPFFITSNILTFGYILFG